MLNNRLFSHIFRHYIVYNTCWEDPKIDRQLMQLNNVRLLTITSGGCNALEYLLDNPEVVYAIDANPCQNALLELKIALFKNGNWDTLFDFFGKGGVPLSVPIYHGILREHLSNTAKAYWDKNITFFDPGDSRPSFYFYGTSGIVAWNLLRYLKFRDMQGMVSKLLASETLEEQAYWYGELEPRLWGSLLKWITNRRFLMTLLGVPSAQRKMIEYESKKAKTNEFIRQALSKIFTTTLMRHNYFWRVYLTGSYTEESCPEYLKKENFETIRNRLDRLHIHTATISDFLEQHPVRFTHFNLLDHMDWLCENQPEELDREIGYIQKRSIDESTLLFRSAGKQNTFLPLHIRNRLHFVENNIEAWHNRSRVGTYGSTHLAILKRDADSKPVGIFNASEKEIVK